MRIHEIFDTFPENVDYIYICHAPNGICKVLTREGNVLDHPDSTLPLLAPAESMLFDAHWRGANATEIAAHKWPKVLDAGATAELDIAQSDEDNARRRAALLDGGQP